MDKELRAELLSAARENGVKHGKTAELDFGAGAEWMYEKLKSHNSEYVSQTKSCRNCRFRTSKTYMQPCQDCRTYNLWEPA